MSQNSILAIGNIYVETNYLGLATGGSNTLIAGKEYRATNWEVRLGGSVVNFVIQAKKFGAKVGLIGKTGQDEAGKKLLELLQAENIEAGLIASSPDVQTSVDTGVVLEHSGENIQLVAGNANQSLSLSDINLGYPKLAEVNAVYLGGFLKQTALYKDYPALLEVLTQKGLQIFLDHGRIPVDVTSDQKEALTAAMKYVKVYLPNEEEILGITGTTDLDEALAKVPPGPEIVVVKLGGKGCRIKTAQADIVVTGHSVKVVSTVGAGDAFNAGFLTQYLAGKSLEECGRFANATGALRVSLNRQPTEEEVHEFLK